MAASFRVDMRVGNSGCIRKAANHVVDAAKGIIRAVDVEDAFVQGGADVRVDAAVLVIVDLRSGSKGHLP